MIKALQTSGARAGPRRDDRTVCTRIRKHRVNHVNRSATPTGIGPRLPLIKIVFCICIKSGADALANLPNLGKVVPGRGCGHFGNETGRA
jgi:hypothetical protein